MTEVRVVVRRATPGDVDAIARVHVASINALGRPSYSNEVVASWGRARSGEPYAAAMTRGETFFIAVEDSTVVGFSSYRHEGDRHRTAIYVAGNVARTGVGTLLFLEAERAAREAGARELHVDASLVAVAFYEKNGFVILGRGVHRLSTGVEMECAFMKKTLPALSSDHSSSRG